MNSLLLKKKKEFKEDQFRKTGKSYIMFPGVLMVKKPIQMKKTKFLTVILEKLFSCCDTDVQFSWVRCWWAWGWSVFLRDIWPIYLNACRSLRLVPCCRSCWYFEPGGFIYACSGQIVSQVKSGVIIHSTRLGKAAPRQMSVLLPEPYLGCWIKYSQLHSQYAEAQVWFYKTYYKKHYFVQPKSHDNSRSIYLLSYNLICLFSLREHWIAVCQKTFVNDCCCIISEFLF